MGQGFSNNRIAFAGNGITQIFVNGVKQDTTAGTEINFTIPSGVKEFKVTVTNLGHSSTGFLLFRLGDSTGVYSTSGDYDSIYAWLGSSSQTAVQSLNAFTNGSFGNTQAQSGTVTFTLHDAATNTWACVGSLMTIDSTDFISWMVGHIVLDSELTTFQLGTTATAFDEGSVNIQYDNPDPTVVADSGHGIVVQQVHTDLNTVVTGTGTFPFDNTIPQISEGSEFITASITPKSTTSILRVEFNATVSFTMAVGNVITSALFRDSDVDALAADYGVNPNGSGYTLSQSIDHRLTAGSTASTTFSIRCGCGVASTNSMGGYNSTDYLGGIPMAYLTITEYEA